MRHNREDYNTSAAHLRPFEEIEAHEWARLERARRTTDPRKLAMLMPAWLKAHMRQSLAPVRAVFDMRTFVPFAGTRQAADTRKVSDFPNLWNVEANELTTAQYVRELEQVWHLRHIANSCDGHPCTDHGDGTVTERPEVSDMVPA